MELKINLKTEPFCCETQLAFDAIETLSYINKKKQGKFSSVAILGDEELMEKLLKTFCRFEFEDDTILSFKNLDYNYVDYEGLYAFVVTLEECYCRELTVSIEKAEYEDDDDYGEYKTYEQDWLYIDEFYEDLIKKHLQFEDTMDVFCITGECEEDEDEEFDKDEFEPDEIVDLYDLVKSMVESILEEKLGRQ